MTIYLEDLTPGLSRSISKAVSERDVELFGEVSGDHNPVHFDEAYARTTVFKGRVAHGVLTISYISALLGNEMPGPGTIFLGAKVNFKAPVRIGDTVVTTCTVREIGERRRVTIDCVCKVGETVVVEAEALVMAPARPKS